MKLCELCGSPVKVAGNTTKHYEPVETEREKILREALERIQRAVGTSTEAWHFANEALEKTKRETP